MNDLEKTGRECRCIRPSIKLAKEWRYKNDVRIVNANDNAAESPTFTPTQVDIMLSEYAAHVEAQRWIPTSEKLPEHGVLVLIRASNGRIDTDAVNQHDGRWEMDDDWQVTHWRPLPPPPEVTK